MSEFSENELENEYKKYSDEKQTYLNDLHKIIVDSKESLEGNSFYYHLTLNLYPELLYKQINLFWCGKQANKKICEIGFNAGHSTMLMLLGRDKTPIDYTVFDIGEHSYVKPCLEYVKNKFNYVNFEYIEGDSTMTMPKWISINFKSIGTYDVIHVDGGHSENCINNDMRNSDKLLKVDGILIVDDTYIPHIKKCVEKYLASGKYIELNVLKTKGYTHRIIKKIRN